MGSDGSMAVYFLGVCIFNCRANSYFLRVTGRMLWTSPLIWPAKHTDKVFSPEGSGQECHADTGDGVLASPQNGGSHFLVALRAVVVGVC